MSLTPLLPDQILQSERELNLPENCPKYAERYVYNGADLRGIRYVDGGIHISGAVRYIREDLVTLKEGVEL